MVIGTGDGHIVSPSVVRPFPEPGEAALLKERERPTP